MLPFGLVGSQGGLRDGTEGSSVWEPDNLAAAADQIQGTPAEKLLPSSL
jgi:hypothetical protein